jgi:hypothetical protein
MAAARHRPTPEGAELAGIVMPSLKRDATRAEVWRDPKSVPTAKYPSARRFLS